MAYNEVETLDRTCCEILEVLNGTVPDAELLIVNDGSTDGTHERADSIKAQEGRIRVIHHARNQGLGGVYRTGFAEGKGDYVTFFPADGQFPAQIIRDFLPRMRDNDLVLGYLPAGSRAPSAEVLSWMERLLYRFLLGKLPRFQGILMFRRELLSRHHLQSTGRGWTILMELIVRCAKANERISSIPTEVRPRSHGSSKVNNMRTIWSNLRQLMALRAVLRRPLLSTSDGEPSSNVAES